MIAKLIGSGRSIAGMAAYGLHDQTSAEHPRPTTSTRVAWTACLGLPTDDTGLMVRAMQGLTADAPALKAAAGLPATGRKLKKPYEHVVFSWPSGAEPSKAEMLEAVGGGLKSLGFDERHYAVCAAHDDTDQAHAHVFISRVDPETGLALKLDASATKRLSRWAEEYERTHGGIVVPGRVAAREAREARIDVTRELRKAGVDGDEARSTAAILHPQPPRARRATKSQPRPTPLTPDQRAEWARLHGRQREDLRRQRAADNERTARRRQEWREWKAARAQARSAGASTPVPPRPRSPSVRQLRADGARERAQLQRRHRTERAQLARRLRSGTVRAFAAVRRGAVAVGRTLWKRATPGRTEPTTKAATARISGPDLQRLETQISAKRDRTRDVLRDAETAVRKAERGAPRQQRTSAPASTTREREARETFEAAVRDARATQRTLRAAARDHAAARDALADATRAASRWTPNRQRASEQRRAIFDAEERLDQARDAELVADGRARWEAHNRQEARDRWRAAAADKRRDRQDRRQRARENRPARRRLQRLRQRVADLRRRLTTLDAALKAVERVLERLGLARRPARPAPPPDRSPSLSSIMHDLDRHVERDYPAPAPEPVRVAKPERPPPSTTPPAPGVRQQPPARERPPTAAPAGAREAGPHAPLIEDLIGAVRAGGSRLSQVRSEFERMNAGDGVKRLVLQAVDPELLEVVVGPRLAPAWVKPLRAQYARFKQAYPADWADVEEVWRKQRARWRSKAAPHREEPHREQSPDPPRPPAPAAGAANKAQHQQQSGHDR